MQKSSISDILHIIFDITHTNLGSSNNGETTYNKASNKIYSLKIERYSLNNQFNHLSFYKNKLVVTCV